jgi:hypothetical protein
MPGYATGSGGLRRDARESVRCFASIRVSAKPSRLCPDESTLDATRSESMEGRV